MSTLAMEHGSVKSIAKYEIGGSLAEGLAGTAAVVLAIIGLTKMWAPLMLATSSLCVGAAMIFQSLSVAKGYWTLLSEVTEDKKGSYELGGGMMVGFLGGTAGIVLGVLALLGIAAPILLSVTALIYGATLVVSSGINAQLNELRINSKEGGENLAVRRITHEAVATTTALQVLVGLTAVTLGIIAVVQSDTNLPLTQTLSLVTMLAAGGTVLLSGTALASRLGTIIRS